MSNFLHFIFLKDHPISGLKSPKKKDEPKDYKPLLDNSSMETLKIPAKPSLSDKTYNSKYYLMSMTR
jgi:hypothetical protein